MDRLAGKVAVISGAAGSVGAAAARAFHAEGARVGLLDRDADGVAALARELGESALPLPADVSSDVEVAQAFDRVREVFGRCDVLYNCVGIQLHGRDGRVHQMDPEIWHRTLAVNLTGVFHCCRHAIRLMLAGGSGGAVINCGSPPALTMGGQGYAAYVASKGAVMALSRELAADYAGSGIRVNTLVPGATRTPLTAGLFGDVSTDPSWVTGIPLGRLGQPADLVGAAVFLASDESRYATGATFVVDGGLAVR